jgi:eukaryotic-like serine/threonine-protein kinase
VVESVIAGRYRLERRIGSGGMSEVWAATDLELERTVAVKLLAADADPARFDREARAAAGLAHANVCAVYDYGLSEGRRFLVLELLPGGSLEDRLAAGRPLADDDTRRIAGEIAAGLAHAHERGVVHRDLKPANVLFDAEGRAKIADFGIARTAGAAGLTEAGTILGTAAYISPEQAAGRPATPASDVYAFGVVLFRMLTGRLPFESPDGLALAAMHRDLPVPPVSELRPDAPPLLESVAAAALAKSPADRPASGAALVTELAGAEPATSDSTAATMVIAPEPQGRRRGLLVGLAVAVVAAAGVALAMAVTIGNGTSPAPPTTTPPLLTRPSVSLPTSEPAETEPPTTRTEERTTAPTESTTAAATTTRPATSSESTTATTGTTTAQTTTAPVTTTSPPTSTAATITTTETTTSGTTTATTTEQTTTATTGATATTTTAPTTAPG